MNKRAIYKILFIIGLITINIACDQVSKVIVRNKVVPHDRIEVLGDLLILTNVENTGAFLSLGSSFNPVLKKILLLGVPSVMMLVILGDI